ncbi:MULTISPECIES: SDR family NAD(P)-dependent oxidoreductase [unclassified Frankia]|uniref:SDR family NAD(P)-dependent oxidoreductase n=1 Tax=unclassified Frankia TaxID=2632575 RepID=UPI001EF6554B|nr:MULTISPECIES: SDR family NAD(P)-dependent oxidoreductase [unclassified Frankia]
MARPSARVVVLTGATAGIGRSLATRLAAEGYRLFAVGRDPSKAAALRSELAGSGAAAETIVADLAAPSGWDAVTERVSAGTEHIDILIHNAGVLVPRHILTDEGWELNLAVHHLAPFALTARLWPLLVAGRPPGAGPQDAKPRVLCVNSAGHHTSLGGHIEPRFDFTDPHHMRGYDPFLAYSRSKLANLYFVYELARRHGDMVTVNAMHPGVTRTDIGRDFPRAFVLAALAFASSPKRAARDIHHLATDPTVTTNGAYYDQTRLTRSSGPSYDTDAARQMWELTERMLARFLPDLFSLSPT